jgi:hypothetical protein
MSLRDDATMLHEAVNDLASLYISDRVVGDREWEATRREQREQHEAIDRLAKAAGIEEHGQDAWPHNRESLLWCRACKQEAGEAVKS